MTTIDQEVDIFLEHYGRKGMKWGTVKKEPTGVKEVSSKPGIKARFDARNLKVNTDRYNMLQARAAKANIRIKELDAEIAAIPKGSKGAAGKRRDLKFERSTNIIQRADDLQKAKKPPSSGMTPTQKKVLIGAGISAVLIGGYVLSKHTDLEGIAASIRRGKSVREHGDIFASNPDFAGKMSHEDVLKNVVSGVNPKYKTQGGSMNCRRATMAYELRRRGYDVQATTSPMGYGQNESGLVNALVKGDKNLISRQSVSNYSHFHDPPSTGVRTRGATGDTREHTAFTESVPKLSGLRAALGKHPTGARGEAVFDMGGFAHSMQWEMFDDGPHIFDSQKAAHYPVTSLGLAKLTGKWGSPKTTEITRLDDVDLDLKFLSRWATNSQTAAPAAPTRVPSNMDSALASMLLSTGSVTR